MALQLALSKGALAVVVSATHQYPRVRGTAQSHAET